MRIALAHPYSWPGVLRGGERILADLDHVLSTAGHEVLVVTGEARPLHRRLARRGLTPMDTFGVSAWAPLARARPDVVHAFVPSAALAGRAAGLPVVHTCLGLPRADHFAGRPVQRRLFDAAVRRSTTVTAFSRAAAEAVRGLVQRDVVELAPGVRLDRFPVDERPRTDPPRLLFAADASDPRKGLPWLLTAFDRLLDLHPDARLQLGCPGDPAPALDQATDRARAATDVLGPSLADVPARYRAATVTVLPSRYEAFGLVLVESLASGTPAVALAEGGPAEILDDPAVGRTAAPRDLDGLVRALHEAIGLARDPATPQRCAAAARRYDWDTVTGPAHEAVYARTVRAARRRR
ncbi:MAG: glycosyltransferase family 4 protein [Actinomycetes bacterium]